MMRTNEQARGRRHEDRGVSIIIIAASMIMILGMAGLSIDLAALYVARSQAQRAADAAALAGANALAGDPTCVNGSGGGLGINCPSEATIAAEAVGDSNLIVGVSPNLKDSDITLLNTSSGNPQVQVVAARDTAHGNPMPTFFVKIFGINTANVSAKAVAEAYTSTGSGPPVGTNCVKPWLVPNCDQYNTDPNQQNPNCAGAAGYFVIPHNNYISSTLARNGPPPNGPIGEPFTMKPGSPGSAAAPGEYYAAYIPPTAGQAPTVCPACASTGGGGGGSGVGSAAVYRANIECCNQNPIVCGPSSNITVSSTAGNMVGPTTQGVDCLIHQSGSTYPTNCGQDTMNTITNPCTNAPPPNIPEPFQLTAGPNNPYRNPGTKITPSTASDSVIVVPIWDGTPLQSGQNSNINIVGFLQVFLQSEGNPQGTVFGTIMNVSSCGDGGSGSGSNGSGGPIIAPGGSPVPVRLIHE